MSHASSADTIYRIDALIEPIIVSFCEQWSRTLPMVVVAEGIEPESGRVFPEGTSEENAKVRIILDPIDGTRGLMYDKRSAWSLAGVAPNKGEATRLSDIEVAVMSELPTSKMGQADVLWAIRGQGACGVREELGGTLRPDDDQSRRPIAPLPFRPSQAETISHGFAMISHFFPATKVLAGQLMEAIVEELIGRNDPSLATVFDDQYISTGGQLYELIMGHDRFNADLRPIFYQIQGRPPGLCCHPYDMATMLVAQEAGVILTDGLGRLLDAPLDVTSGMAWAGYANPKLRNRIEPVLRRFFVERGIA